MGVPLLGLGTGDQGLGLGTGSGVAGSGQSIQNGMGSGQGGEDRALPPGVPGAGSPPRAIPDAGGREAGGALLTGNAERRG